MIARWEISKLAGNWKKATTVFLLPAVIMMLALNVFPVLVNYLNTGNIGMKSVYVVNPPDSFKDFTEEEINAGVYKYEFYTMSEFEKVLPPENFTKELSSGRLVIFFEDRDNTIRVTYDADSFVMDTRALQFETTVLEPYIKNVVYGSQNLFETDAFNPVTTIMTNRANGNAGASRIMPGMILLLMYYCVYSLNCDMFAAERDRGFMTKLVMTPISKTSIIAGKLIATMAVVMGSAFVIFIMLFFSSWLNRSNDPMSLLPFGMLLLPAQILKLILVIPPTAFLMSAVTLNITLSLRKMQDIIINLQLPLIYFLIDFFLTIFRGSDVLAFEYILPLHNTTAFLIDMLNSNDSFAGLLMIISLNLLLGILVLRKALTKEII